MVIETWPSAPPKPWNEAMANSAFKAQVIQYVVDHLIPLLKLRCAELIIDWNGDSYLHVTYIDKDERWVEVVPRTVWLGEADVKFRHWATLLERSMAVLSIDGDYVPIAMGIENIPIQIFRHSWIDISKLKLRSLSYQQLVLLIALTGTDFSRQLPFLKPKQIYSHVHGLKRELNMICDDPGNMELGIRLVAALYWHKFHKYSSHKYDYAMFRNSVIRSSLAKSTKEKLPSLERVCCTLRNSAFVYKYWTNPILVTNSNTTWTDYGFTENDEGLTTWLETI